MSEKEIEKVESKKSDLDKQIDEISVKLTSKVMEGVGESIDKLEEKINKASKGTAMKKFTSKNDVDKKKSMKDMSADDRAMTYWKAVITDDRPTIKAFSDEAHAKALSEGVVATGGNLIPQDMHTKILKDLRGPNRQRGLVNVFRMKTNVRTFNLEDTRVNTYWTSESATKTTTTASWSRDTITAYKLAAIIRSSDELLADSWMFDIVKEITGQFAERIGDVEDQVITQGTGVGQPTGYITAAPTAVAAAGGGISFDDINNLHYALPTQYRNRGTYQVHNQNIRKIAGIKDNNGRYLYNDSQSQGDPATLKGKPVVENNWMPANQIAFGDFKHGYYFGDRQAMTIETNRFDTKSWEKDQTSIRVVERIGGDLLVPNAVRRLTGVS